MSETQNKKTKSINGNDVLISTPFTHVQSNKYPEMQQHKDARVKSSTFDDNQEDKYVDIQVRQETIKGEQVYELMMEGKRIIDIEEHEGNQINKNFNEHLQAWLKKHPDSIIENNFNRILSEFTLSKESGEMKKSDYGNKSAMILDNSVKISLDVFISDNKTSLSDKDISFANLQGESSINNIYEKIEHGDNGFKTEDAIIISKAISQLDTYQKEPLRSDALKVKHYMLSIAQTPNSEIFLQLSKDVPWRINKSLNTHDRDNMDDNIAQFKDDKSIDKSKIHITSSGNQQTLVSTQNLKSQLLAISNQVISLKNNEDFLVDINRTASNYLPKNALDLFTTANPNSDSYYDEPATSIRDQRLADKAYEESKNQTPTPEKPPTRLLKSLKNFINNHSSKFGSTETLPPNTNPKNRTQKKSHDMS